MRNVTVQSFKDITEQLLSAHKVSCEVSGLSQYSKDFVDKVWPLVKVVADININYMGYLIDIQICNPNTILNRKEKSNPVKYLIDRAYESKFITIELPFRNMLTGFPYGTMAASGETFSIEQLHHRLCSSFFEVNPKHICEQGSSRISPEVSALLDGIPDDALLKEYLHLMLYGVFLVSSDVFSFSDFCGSLLECSFFNRLPDFWKGFSFWHAGGKNREQAAKFLDAVIKQQPDSDPQAYHAAQMLLSSSNLSLKELVSLLSRVNDITDKISSAAPKHQPAVAPEHPLPCIEISSLSPMTIEEIVNEFEHIYQDAKKREELVTRFCGKVITPALSLIDSINFDVFLVHYAKLPNIDKDFLDAVVLGVALLLEIRPKQIHVILPAIALRDEKQLIDEICEILTRNAQSEPTLFQPESDKKMIYCKEIHRWGNKLPHVLYDYIKARALRSAYGLPIAISFIAMNLSERFVFSSQHNRVCSIKIPDNYGLSLKTSDNKQEREDARILDEYKAFKQTMVQPGNRPLIKTFVREFYKLETKDDIKKKVLEVKQSLDRSRHRKT